MLGRFCCSCGWTLNPKPLTLMNPNKPYHKPKHTQKNPRSGNPCESTSCRRSSGHVFNHTWLCSRKPSVSPVHDQLCWAIGQEHLEEDMRHRLYTCMYVCRYVGMYVRMHTNICMFKVFVCSLSLSLFLSRLWLLRLKTIAESCRLRASSSLPGFLSF